MKKLITTLILISVLLSTSGCSSWSNWAGGVKANLSNKPATVTCYSGGKEVYKTVTRGKVTTNGGDMASFYDTNGYLVEAFADCFYVYDQQ
jgi:Domain of unknown function (DUF5052)